jgi:hypothetical protein
MRFKAVEHHSGMFAVIDTVAGPEHIDYAHELDENGDWFTCPTHGGAVTQDCECSTADYPGSWGLPTVSYTEQWALYSELREEIYQEIVAEHGESCSVPHPPIWPNYIIDQSHRVECYCTPGYRCWVHWAQDHDKEAQQ